MLELVAHRGYAARFPENTLVALEAAVSAGARYVEVDVQMTRDGVPVLFHDRDCQRLCGVAGAIADFSYADLARFVVTFPERFGDRFTGNPIASLAHLVDFLRCHSEVTAFVEIKRQAVRAFSAKGVVETVRAIMAEVLDQVILISFSLPALVAARPLWPRLGVVTRRYCEFGARTVQSLHPEYHFCDDRGLPALGSLAHVDCALVVYEVGDADRARALEARGVGFVETFAIAELYDALKVMRL